MGGDPPSRRNPSADGDDPTIQRRKRTSSREAVGRTIPASRRVPPSSPATAGSDRLAGSGAGSGRQTRVESLGHFHLGAELGRGGMGQVRVATDGELRREVAVKMLLRAGRPTDAVQFVEEAQITGQLEHPNIVPVHELGRDEAGRPWIAMKKIDGTDLQEMIRRGSKGRLDAAAINRILAIFGKVCDAVAFAHHRGVIHRDLKPANVMVGAWGEVLVVDWGLAKPLHGRDQRVVRTTRRDSDRHVTLDGDVFGTPAYMPPEQADGRVDEIDERSDIFALGGILYEMLTLEPPYSGRTSVEILAAAARHQLVPPRQRAPQRGIPRELAATVMKAMAAEPADRYATVAELQADLGAWATHEQGTAWRDNPVARLRKWTRRHPQISLAAALLLFASLVVVALFGLWQAAEQARELAVAERDRLRLETERAELRDLAQRDEIDDLRQRLGVEVTRKRDAAIRAFDARWGEARAAGRTDEQFIASLGEARIDECLAAYERLFELAAEGGTVQVTAEDWFRRGLLRRMGKQDNAGALADFTRAIELAPDHGAAYTGRAVARMELADYDGALADCEQAVRLNPDAAENYVNRGSVRSSLGDTAGAIEDYTRAIRLDRRYAVAYFNRANARYDQGDLEGAVADYGRAIEVNERYGMAWFNRAHVKQQLGDLPGALADYDQAVRYRPDALEPRYNRGTLRLETGDLAGALADYTRAIEIDPQDARSYTNRGLVRSLLGDQGGALADYNRALDLDRRLPEAWNNRGRWKVKEGDFAGAIADFTHAINVKPDYANAWLNRSVARFKQRDMDGAIADATRAIDIDARIADAHFTRGAARKAQGDLSGAIDDCTRAIELQPRHAKAIVNRAAAYYALGRFADAHRDLVSAVQLDPRDWRSRVNLALVLARLDRRDEARDAFDGALECCPPDQRDNVRSMRRRTLGE